jgi:hypothetical protein
LLDGSSIHYCYGGTLLGTIVVSYGRCTRENTSSIAMAKVALNEEILFTGTYLNIMYEIPLLIYLLLGVEFFLRS